MKLNPFSHSRDNSSSNSNKPPTPPSPQSPQAIRQAASESSQIIVMITGANRGLGFQVAQKLGSIGNYHILVGARSPQKATEAVRALCNTGIDESVFSPITIDLTSDASINMAFLFVSSTFGRLDILINNAAIGTSSAAPTLRERYIEVFNTNVFGTACLTDAFLPLLRKSLFPQKRIVNVSSGVGSHGYAQDPACPYSAETFPGHVYRSTKAALNMLTVVDAAQLRADGIQVVSVCPGFMETAFNDYKGQKPVEEGAKAVIRAATEAQVNGKFLTDDVPEGVFPW